MRDWLADYQALKFNRPADGILEIILEKPGTLNSVTAQMHTELVRVWRDIDSDPEVNVALVRGSGGKFSSGGDYDLIEAMMRDSDTRLRVWKEARDLVYNLINCAKPVVAAVEGPAVGAGLAVAAVTGPFSITRTNLLTRTNDMVADQSGRGATNETSLCAHSGCPGRFGLGGYRIGRYRSDPHCAGGADRGRHTRFVGVSPRKGH